VRTGICFGTSSSSPAVTPQVCNYRH
jgi:hypothetical protein